MLITKKKIQMVGLLLLLLLAVGCSPAQPTQAPTEEAPVATELPTQTPTESPTATQQEDLVAEPGETEEPEESETDEALSSGETNACVDCHTDPAMLVDTADPFEEVESENEGAG